MNKPSTVAIFVDYDNIFISMEQYYRDFTKPLLPYTVIQSIQKKYENDNIVALNLYADLQNIRIGYTGFDILNSCQVDLRHVSKGKNSSDIVLMLDCIKMLHQYPNLNKVIIVSSDSDMSPVCKECQMRGVEVEVIYVELIASKEYVQKLSRCNITAYSIEELLRIPVANIELTTKELFAFITQDSEYLQHFLLHISNIIRDVYEKYEKHDRQGRLVSAGATSLASLSYHIKDKRLLPDYLTNKQGEYSTVVDMMAQCGIIVPTRYHTRYQELTTWILSSDFMDEYNCTCPNAIGKGHFTMETEPVTPL